MNVKGLLKVKKRILSLLLVLCMIAGLLPMLPRVQAAEPETPADTAPALMPEVDKWVETGSDYWVSVYMSAKKIDDPDYCYGVRMTNDIEYTLGHIFHQGKTSDQLTFLYMDIITLGLWELVVPIPHKMPEWDPVGDDDFNADEYIHLLTGEHAFSYVQDRKVLDLCGHDLIIHYPNVDAGYATMFYLTEGSELTVVDSVGGGRIYFDGYIFAAEDYNYFKHKYGDKDQQRDVFTVEKDATLTLSGVTVETGRSKLEYGFNMFNATCKKEHEISIQNAYTGSATKYVNGSAVVNHGGTVNINSSTLIGRGYEVISNETFNELIGYGDHTRNGVIESTGGTLNLNDAVIQAKGGADCLQLWDTKTHITSGYFSLHRNDALFCGWTYDSTKFYCIDDEQNFGRVGIPTNSVDWANVRVDYAGKGHGAVMGDNDKWRTAMAGAEGHHDISDMEPWMQITPVQTEPITINVASRPESEGQTVVTLNPQIKGQLAFRVPFESPFAENPLYESAKKVWEFKYALKDADGKTLWTETRSRESDDPASTTDPAFISLDWYEKALKQIQIGKTYYLTCDYGEMYCGAKSYVTTGSAAVQFIATDLTVPELNAQISSSTGSFTVAKKGDSLTLTASAVGATQAWWERTSSQEGGSKEDGTFTYDATTNTGTASLTVPVNAVYRYTCVLANDQGEVRTNPVELHYGISFSDGTEETVVEHVAYTESNYIYMGLPNDGGGQVLSYTWTKYESTTAISGTTIVKNGHTDPLNSQQLAIFHPQLSDAGYYRCRVKTASGDFLSPWLHLTVVEGYSPSAITTTALTGFDTSSLCQGMTAPTDVQSTDERYSVKSVAWSTGVSPAGTFYGGDASLKIELLALGTNYFQYDSNGNFRWSYNGKTYTAYGDAGSTAKGITLRIEFLSYYNQGIKSFSDNIELAQTSYYFAAGQTVDLRLPITVTCPDVHTTHHELREVMLGGSSTLPDGISMDESGHITGTLNVPDGVYRFMVNPITTYGHQSWFYIYFIVGQVSDAELQAAGVPLNEHTWSKWTNNGDGTHSATCTDCGKVKTEPHRWGEAETVVAPTEDQSGTLRYTCLDCGATHTEAVGSEGTAKNNTYFNDVDFNAYYMNPVLWAIEHSITAGTSATTFSPIDTCTRAQIVTFLWRAAGSPEPATTNNPFKDVTSDKYYYKAVLWAAEAGITSGTAADKFSPNNGCTRAQVVTFLWRFAGSPKPTATTNSFTDVKSGAYYYNAVLWAAESKVTAGTSATTFSPEQTCTRSHIVTFLYRYMGE